MPSLIGTATIATKQEVPLNILTLFGNIFGNKESLLNRQPSFGVSLTTPYLSETI
jgi:hypothetical protein